MDINAQSKSILHYNCPSCRTLLKEKSEYCPHCGSLLILPKRFISTNTLNNLYQFFFRFYIQIKKLLFDIRILWHHPARRWIFGWRFICIFLFTIILLIGFAIETKKIDFNPYSNETTKYNSANSKIDDKVKEDNSNNSSQTLIPSRPNSLGEIAINDIWSNINENKKIKEEHLYTTGIILYNYNGLKIGVRNNKVLLLRVDNNSSTYNTDKGIHIGSTLQDLQKAYGQSLQKSGDSDYEYTNITDLEKIITSYYLDQNNNVETIVIHKELTDEDLAYKAILECVQIYQDGTVSEAESYFKSKGYRRNIIPLMRELSKYDLKRLELIGHNDSEYIFSIRSGSYSKIRIVVTKNSNNEWIISSSEY